MIEIKCITKDTISLTEAVPFQGNLKKRTQQDIDQLKESLLHEGLLMPFAIWCCDDKKMLLDGHGRKEALIQMAVEDPSLLTMKWPCVYIEAATENDARKALLQITSSYGKITKMGVKQFCASIPDYKAPSIQKFIPKQDIKTENKDRKAKVSDSKIIRVKVPKDKFEQVIEIFKQFDFIEII